MSKIIYYCDNCGHVFNNPHTEWKDVDGRDEDESKCPKCGNHDYELINEVNQEKNEKLSVTEGNNSSISNSPIVLAFSPLVSRFRSANIRNGFK